MLPEQMVSRLEAGIMACCMESCWIAIQQQKCVNYCPKVIQRESCIASDLVMTTGIA